MGESINVKTLKSIIGFAAKAKKKGVNIPLFVWGAHGIGKTTVMNDTANDLGYECVPLNLANQTPEELLGRGSLNDETKTTDYYKPDWLKTDSKKPVIYFIDELNRAPKYVLQAIFSFVNEGRLHTHHINEHDIIVAAGNPDDLDYDVTGFEDKAFRSRFAHLYFEPDHGEVIQYLADREVHPCVLEMLKEDGEIFDNVAVTEAAKLKVSPDPRMMEKVGQILNMISPEEMKQFGMELVEAMIGTDKAAILLQKFINQDEIPEPKDLVEGKIQASVLSHDRMDIINTFNTKLVKYLKEEGIFKKANIPAKVSVAMKSYIEYIPKDSALGLVKEMKLAKVATIELIKLFKGVDQSFLFDVMEVPVSQ